MSETREFEGFKQEVLLMTPQERRDKLDRLLEEKGRLENQIDYLTESFPRSIVDR